MSFGLALSGGGAKGAAHVGVMLALKEAGMVPSSIAGTSAGALVAGLYAAGNSPENLNNLVNEVADRAVYYFDPDFRGILKIIPDLFFRHTVNFPGILKGNRIESLIARYAAKKKLQDAAIRTVIPAVDLNSGKTIAYTNSLAGVKPLNGVEWKTDILISDAMRASMAVPVVFHPKAVGGMCLVDGGITDVLPVDLLLAAGEKNVLAVDLAEEYKPPETQNIIEITGRSLSIMETRLKAYRSTGEKLLLNPQLPKESGLLTFSQMKEYVEIGYETAAENMPVIQAIFR
ncbi:MAG: phospholipase [Clostridiales bacterium]|nr:phospholipase [Clostridiales bacterium]